MAFCTGKSFSEALIFASTNPQYDDRLFIELQVQYMKIPSSEYGENMLCTEFVSDIQKNDVSHNRLKKKTVVRSLWKVQYHQSHNFRINLISTKTILRNWRWALSTYLIVTLYIKQISEDVNYMTKVDRGKIVDYHPKKYKYWAYELKLYQQKIPFDRVFYIPIVLKVS